MGLSSFFLFVSLQSSCQHSHRCSRTLKKTRKVVSIRVARAARTKLSKRRDVRRAVCAARTAGSAKT